MIRPRIMILLLGVVLLAGCTAPAAAPRNDAARPAPSQPEAIQPEATLTPGALKSTLQSTFREGGVVTICIVTTNSAETSQPIAVKRESTHASDPAVVSPNQPWLMDAAGKAVRAADSPYSTGVEADDVWGGPPTDEPEVIAPGGTVQVTAAFVDPGSGATLYYAPGGRDGATSATTNSWKLPKGK